jgi:hypothetical protein
VRLIELPFGYTYLSRLKNYRALVGYLTREWIPLIVTLQVAYSAEWWVSIVMFLGFLSLYECGYLVNDIADSSNELGGNRIKGLRINGLLFWLSHLFVFVFAAGLLWLIRGQRFAANFAGLGVLVCGVLMLHTSLSTRRFRFLRISTFTVLAVYKFAPIVLPQVSFAGGQSLLMAVFLCYGFPRVIVYGLRKFGDAEARRTVEEFFRWFEFAGLVCFGPILATARLETREAMAVTLIFALYCIISGLFMGLHLVRVKFSRQREQAF